jgi:hypothetical protein
MVFKQGLHGGDAIDMLFDSTFFTTCIVESRAVTKCPTLHIRYTRTVADRVLKSRSRIPEGKKINLLGVKACQHRHIPPNEGWCRNTRSIWAINTTETNYSTLLGVLASPSRMRPSWFRPLPQISPRRHALFPRITPLHLFHHSCAII